MGRLSRLYRIEPILQRLLGASVRNVYFLCCSVSYDLHHQYLRRAKKLDEIIEIKTVTIYYREKNEPFVVESQSTDGKYIDECIEECIKFILEERPYLNAQEIEICGFTVE